MILGVIVRLRSDISNMQVNRQIQYFVLSAIVFSVAIACFFSGRYLYQSAYYEEIIIGLFLLWLVVLLIFFRFAKKNNFKVWWIFCSTIFLVHPIEILAMVLIWSVGGFV